MIQHDTVRNGRLAVLSATVSRRRLTALFDIYPGEGRLVAWLALLYFFLGFTFVFTQAAGFALFLASFTARGLPYAYIAIAVVASLLSFGYLRLAARLPLPRLLLASLIFFLLVSVALRFALTLPDSRWVVFALPIWFQVLLNLGNIVFWTLAGRLFDMRQGKRLFGLIGAGMWVATITGGFLVPPLVAQVGTPNLLLLAAGSVFVALGFLVAILRVYGSGSTETAERASVEKQRSNADLLRNRYVVLICATIVVWWVTHLFVDNIFYSQAAVQFPDADQLASFLGLLSGAQGVLALITTTFLTSRIIGRYGLQPALLIVPGTLICTIGALAITGTLGGPLALLFWLVALGKLISVALGFSLEQAGFVILYQPLPPEQRLRAQTLAEGIVQPLAVGLAGIILLVCNTMLSLGAVQLSYLFLAIAVARIIAVVVLVREYPRALRQALARRRLGTSELGLVDPSSAAVLEQAVRSPHPEAVIYAARLLEQTEHPSLMKMLPELLDHPAPEVRRDALERVERLHIVPVLPAVRRRVTAESSPGVRAAAVRTLAALGEADVLEEVAAYLDDPTMEVRRGAMAGLFQNGGVKGILAAGQKLPGLTASPEPAERVLAAQVLGDAGMRGFYQPLWPLLHDRDPEVRRAALLAAGQIKHPKLWTTVVEALAMRGLRAAAAQALVAGGEAIVPELEAAFASRRYGREVRIGLARVCRQLGGEQVVTLLREMIDAGEPVVRTEILGALHACGYHATGAAAGRIQQQIKAEVTQATWFLAAAADIGDDAPAELLAAALDHQLHQARERIFLLLALIYDGPTMLQARDALLDRSGAQRAYALEVVDTQLTPELKAYVLPLLDDLTPEQRLRRLGGSYPQPGLSRERRLPILITGMETREEPWIRACAIYTAGRLSLTSCKEAVVAALDAPEPVVRDTARWTLMELETAAYDRAARRQGDHRMLATIEKVLILKTVGIFAETPDDVLADVATLLEEVDLPAGATLFEKGDAGNSMYIIVSGSMRIHDGEHTLSELGERQVFGEMALLDPEPRVASATARADTQLFCLPRQPFYELMADRPEVAHGIIRVLTGYVRARVRDVANLNARIQELERTAPEPGQPRAVGAQYGWEPSA